MKLTPFQRPGPWNGRKKINVWAWSLLNRLWRIGYDMKEKLSQPVTEGYKFLSSSWRLRLAPQFLSTFLVLGASRRHRTGLQLSSLTSHSCPASVHKIERNKRKVCWTRDVRRGRRPEACGSFYFLLTVSSRTLPSSNLPRVMPCGFLLSFHGIQLLDGLEGCGRQS